MRDILYAGAVALALVGLGGIAMAQQQDQAQQPQPTQPQGKMDQPVGEGQPQGERPGKIDGQEGNTAGSTPEGGQAIGLAPSDPNSTDGAEGAAVNDPTETTPAKHSPVMAERDAHWWLDRGQALTPEQKRTIYARLARDGAQAGSGVKVFAEASAIVPPEAELREIPKQLTTEIPYIEDFRYLVEENQVVLVDPVNHNVAAVIGEQERN